MFLIYLLQTAAAAGNVRCIISCVPGRLDTLKDFMNRVLAASSVLNQYEAEKNRSPSQKCLGSLPQLISNLKKAPKLEQPFFVLLKGARFRL